VEFFARDLCIALGDGGEQLPAWRIPNAVLQAVVDAAVHRLAKLRRITRLQVLAMIGAQTFPVEHDFVLDNPLGASGLRSEGAEENSQSPASMG
jgi:hypothetical protein